MSRNKYAPRVDIIPEDEANQKLALGFQLHHAVNDSRMNILPIARGWKRVLDEFLEAHVAALREHSSRLMILLIDFDEKDWRRPYFEAKIPDDLKSRVFVIGSWDKPEKLNVGGKYEEFGKSLAAACFDDNHEVLIHQQLAHNLAEVERMRDTVRPILFDD